MIKAIIFDLGNVLVRVNNQRTLPLIQKYLKDQYELPVLERLVYYGYHHPENSVESAMHDTQRKFHLGEIDAFDLYQHLIKHLGFSPEFTFKRFQLIWPARFERIEGTINILKALSNYKKYLLSDTNELDAGYLQKHHTDIFQEFDCLFFSHLTGVQKSNRKAWDQIIVSQSIEAVECVFIDDRPEYVERANHLGMNGILFRDAKELQQELNAVGVNLNK